MTGRGDSKNHRAPSRWRKIGILALALVPLGTAIVWRRFTPKARFTPVFEASRAVTCDVACVRARTVHVELRDGRSCGGVRLGHLDARYVLTAAHCARRAPVSVEFVGGVRASVRSVHEMAPGEPLAPGSPHDAAILVVDSAPGLEVFVDAEAHLPALLALPQRDAGSLAVELVPIAISVANSVRYTITGPRERLCHGTSGSPVWTRSGRGYNLSGIVSSGARACTGSASVLRFEGIELALAPLLKSRSSLVSPSCRACVESLGEGLGPCVIPLDRCQADTTCRAALESLDTSHELDTLSQNLERCARAHGCSAACRAN